VRRLAGGVEVVDERLRVRHAVRDHPGESPAVLGVLQVEAALDEVRVVAVLGEDDGLAQDVTARDLVTLAHQRRQHLVDRVLVEEEAVQLLGRDGVGYVAVLAPLERVPLVLLLVAQGVVPDAFAHEPERHRDADRWHEVLLRDGVVEAVGVGRHAA
jgi:hypothetical protein